MNASYPSGHTAASIAVYCGLALLLTSMIKNRIFRVAVWSVAVLIPAFEGTVTHVSRDASPARRRRAES